MKLPVGWQKLKLKDLISGDIKNGYSPVCESTDSAWGWVLSLGALTPQGLDYTQRKAAPTDIRLVRVKLQENDILISRSNTPERVGMSSIFHSQGEDYFYPDLMMRFQFNPEKIFPLFGWYFLNLPVSRSYLKKKASGTSNSMVKITSSTVKAIDILLPPLSEQQRIAEFLGTWDEAIEKLERLIEAKEKRLSWIRTNILTGKIRIKGHCANWKLQRLSCILHEHGEKSSTQELVHSVSVHKGVVNQIEHLGRAFAAKDTSNYNLVKPGDIIYTKSPTGNFPYGIIKLNQNDYNVIVSPLYGVFTPKWLELGIWLDCYFEAPKNAINYLHPIIQKGQKIQSISPIRLSYQIPYFCQSRAGKFKKFVK